MKMDLGQNNLEKSLLIFSEAKASWVYTRLAHKTMPNLTVCTLLPTQLHQNWKNIQSFSSSFLLCKKSFFSFLFIFLFLDAQKRLTFGVIMTSPWATKSVEKIDDAFSISAIVQRERMHLLKATGSSFLHFKGRCTIIGVGFPLYPTRWHIRGSWQRFKCLCCLWNSA